MRILEQTLGGGRDAADARATVESWQLHERGEPEGRVRATYDYDNSEVGDKVMATYDYDGSARRALSYTESTDNDATIDFRIDGDYN